jgi:hypothetical protein
MSVREREMQRVSLVSVLDGAERREGEGRTFSWSLGLEEAA